MFLILLFYMVIAHCYMDMNQPSFLAKNKNRKPVIMFFHALMVSGVVSIPIYILVGVDIMFVLSVMFLVLSHMIIDKWKSGTPKDEEHFHYIYIDQGYHLLCMIFVATMEVLYIGV